MKISILSIFCILLLFKVHSIYPQVWTKVDGTSNYVNRIYFPPDNSNQVIVASDGIPTDFLKNSIEFPYYGVGQYGYQISDDRGNNFSPKILNGYSVYDIYQVPHTNNIWLASVRKMNQGGILVSYDKGATWNEDYLYCDGPAQVIRFCASNEDRPYIYTASVNTNRAFRYTIDTFKTCNDNNQLSIQSRSIAVSPFNPSLIFLAGDKLYQNGVFRSYNKGKTWLKDSLGLEGLRVHCVLASRYNPAIVLCGADSINPANEVFGKGIYLSVDTGKTWKLVGAKGSVIFRLVEHPSNPKYLAAAGNLSGVWISGSWGFGWEQFNDGFPDSSSVRTVAIPDWEITNDGFVVFAGVYGYGLYKSKKIITSKEDSNNNYSSSSIKIENQLIHDENFKIEYNGDPSDKIILSIRDCLGKEIISKHYVNLYQKSNISINLPPHIPNGIYFIYLRNDREILTSKFILIR